MSGLQSKSKILVLDIETKPALAYVWGLFDQNIGLNQLVSPSAPICFAAKWVGKDEMYFAADWLDGGHEGMIDAAHALLDEADAVVTYNGDGFDLKKLRGEFVLGQFPPPAPYSSIDLLKVVKKFGIQSNKLAYVGPFFGIGEKVANEGFSLWEAVMRGDKDAQERMMNYNIGDVTLTEELYNYVLPYIENHPHLGSGGQCPNCGSNHIQNRGYRRTRLFKVARIQCMDCGAWSSGTRSKV